jgi:hypothetical protein
MAATESLTTGSLEANSFFYPEKDIVSDSPFVVAKFMVEAGFFTAPVSCN